MTDIGATLRQLGEVAGRDRGGGQGFNVATVQNVDNLADQTDEDVLDHCHVWSR